jgi:hypothetical protein
MNLRRHILAARLHSRFSAEWVGRQWDLVCTISKTAIKPGPLTLFDERKMDPTKMAHLGWGCAILICARSGYFRATDFLAGAFAETDFTGVVSTMA